MPTRYQHKRRTTAGQVPVAADVLQGEIVLNVADGAGWTKDASNNLKKLFPPDAATGSTPMDWSAKYAWGYEDFYQHSYPNGWWSGLGENHNAGGIVQAISEQNAPGIVSFYNAGAGSRAALISNYARCIRLGGGEAIFETRIRVTEGLSENDNAYVLRFGFMNDAGGDPTYGVYFRYTHDANSGLWQGKTKDLTNESTVNLDTGPVTSGWQKLRVVVNAAGNRADFYINGTNKGNLTTNIPTASGREVGIGASIVSSTGTTRSFYMDYLAWQIEVNR